MLSRIRVCVLASTRHDNLQRLSAPVTLHLDPSGTRNCVSSRLMLKQGTGACEQQASSKADASAVLDSQENRQPRVEPERPPLEAEFALAEVQGATPPRAALRRLRRVGDSAVARGGRATAMADTGTVQSQPADTTSGCETHDLQTTESVELRASATAPCEAGSGGDAVLSAYPGTGGSDGDAERGDANDAALAGSEALAKPRRRLRRKGSLPLAGTPLADAVPSDGDTDALADVLGSMSLAPPSPLPPPPAPMASLPPLAAAAVPSPVHNQQALRRPAEASSIQAAAPSESDDDDEGAAHESLPSAPLAVARQLGGAPPDAPAGAALEYEHAPTGARCVLCAH